MYSRPFVLTSTETIPADDAGVLHVSAASLTYDERLFRAALFVRDARAGREAKVHRTRLRVLRVYACFGCLKCVKNKKTQAELVAPLSLIHI